MKKTTKGKICCHQKDCFRLSDDISKITFFTKYSHDLPHLRPIGWGCVLADHGERKSNLLGQLLADDVRCRCSNAGGGTTAYIYLLLSSTLQGFPFYPISLLYQFPTPDSISRGYPLIDLSPPLPLLFRIARPPPLPTPPEYLPESRERLLNAREVRGKFCDSSKN